MALATIWQPKFMKKTLKVQERKNTRDLARETFLQEIKRFTPFVLDDLEKNVLTEYPSVENETDFSYSMSSSYLPDSLSERAKQNCFNFESDYRSLPVERHASIRFQKTLVEWACQYNLIDAWLFREALCTLKRWKRVGFDADWNYSLEPKKSYKNGFGLVNFDFEPYKPELETWRSYRNRAGNSFNNFLKNYRQGIENEKLDFQAFQKNAETHYKWLIEYQIRGWNYEEICLENGINELARISEAIKPLAHLMDLTLKNDLNKLRKK